MGPCWLYKVSNSRSSVASMAAPTTYPTPTSGALSAPQGAALTTAAVLGTGVISLPALAAGVAGPASILAWLGLVLLSVPLAATFAALGRRFPDSGGVATYARRAFGDRVAGMVGWVFYFAVPVGATPAAAFAGAYVADVLGGGERTTMLTAVAILALVTTMNLCGLRVAGRVQLVLSGVLVTLLVVVAAAALPHARVDHLTPFAPHSWLAVAPAAAVLVWGFTGWEAVTSLSSEYRHPQRDVPRATAVAVAVVGVLYLGVAGASILVLGGATATSRAPLSDLLAMSFGSPARWMTAVVAVLLTVGTINAYVAGSARLGAALGRDGALPSWFARGSSAGEVPRRSLLVVAGLSFAGLGVTVATGLDLTATVLLTTGSFTLVYVVGTAAAVRLLPRGSWARRGALVSLVSVLGLLAVTGIHVLWGVAVALTALAHGTWVRRRAAPRALAAGGTVTFPCASS
jgi:amino acid efflux transporter